MTFIKPAARNSNTEYAFSNSGTRRFRMRKSMVVSNACASALVAIVLLIVPARALAGEDWSNHTLTSLEQQLFDKINTLRQACGLGKFASPDKGLSYIARKQAQDLQNYSESQLATDSHIGADGSTSSQRIGRVYPMPALSGDINSLIYGLPDVPEMAVNGWLDDVAHAQIFLEEFEFAGVGIAKGRRPQPGTTGPEVDFYTVVADFARTSSLPRPVAGSVDIAAKGFGFVIAGSTGKEVTETRSGRTRKTLYPAAGSRVHLNATIANDGTGTASGCTIVPAVPLPAGWNLVVPSFSVPPGGKKTAHYFLFLPTSMQPGKYKLELTLSHPQDADTSDNRIVNQFTVVQ
jgi:uncharacterized protein YkwD